MTFSHVERVFGFATWIRLYGYEESAFRIPSEVPSSTFFERVIACERVCVDFPIVTGLVGMCVITGSLLLMWPRRLCVNILNIGSKSVAGAKADFDWLCKNILHLFRDTEIDVRSSAKYRQVSWFMVEGEK